MKTQYKFDKIRHEEQAFSTFSRKYQFIVNLDNSPLKMRECWDSAYVWLVKRIGSELIDWELYISYDYLLFVGFNNLETAIEFKLIYGNQ